MGGGSSPNAVHGVEMHDKETTWNSGRFAKAQNLSLSVQDPHCESRAKTVKHLLILNQLLQHNSLSLRDTMSVECENLYIRKL